MDKYQDIRQLFTKYFENNGHEHKKSFSLIPQDDPTLLFVNSGMVGFKKNFLDAELKPNMTTVQKCIRAGGKHNDLENVGYTKRHHTFFEMLGNFSFGDYFKEKAIYYAWNLLVNEFKIDKNRLLVTVYHDDKEAEDLWRKIAGLPDEKIIKISTNDNFWSMADDGLCGPCSEIFYDHGDTVFGGIPGSKDQDGDRFMEIWNLVFMQFDRLKSGELNTLQKKCIDTGAGLERIACVMEGVCDNYDTSLFKNIITNIQDVYSINSDKYSLNYRVVADHIRSISFMISEGITPSNEGRGYVLRRIMRRAMRYLHQIDEKSTKMHKLVENVVNVMKIQYPELQESQKTIESVIQNEEELFKDNLTHGIRLICKEIGVDSIGNITKNHRIDGKTAFKLYDTYGFPIDMTADLLKSQGGSVDLDGFNAEMQIQKNRSQQSWKGNESSDLEAVIKKFQEKTELTTNQDFAKNEVSAKVLFLHKDGQFLYAIFDKTCCYYESGGQQSDYGYIFDNNDCKIAKITDVQRKYGVILHKLELVSDKNLQSGEDVLIKTDLPRRRKLKIGHTATHLLQAALKKEIGDDIRQMGSSISENGLRFDFNSKSNLTQAQIENIEKSVKNWIADHIPIKIMNNIHKEEAIKLGATANFGEKYGDFVRVIDIPHASIELCGGMHVDNTGEIEDFAILKSYGVSSGIYRIEAITGNVKAEQTIHKITSLLSVEKDEIVENIEKLIKTNKENDKKLQDYKIQDLTSKINIGDDKLKYGIINGHKEDSSLIKDAIGRFLDNTGFTGIGMFVVKTGDINIFCMNTRNNSVDISLIFAKIKEKCTVNGGGNKKFVMFNTHNNHEDILKIITESI